MRGSVVAFWVTVKSWLISTGSVPQLACFALLPVVAAGLFGLLEDQVFLSTVSSSSPSFSRTQDPLVGPILSALGLTLRPHIRSLAASAQEAQPETAGFADMQLRYDSIFPFDGYAVATNSQPGERLDPAATATLPAAPPVPSMASAKRAADALIDRAMRFDQNGFVSETLAHRALSLWPGSYRAKFVLGKILTNRDDERGIEMLIEAADHDPRMVAQARLIIGAFAERHHLSPYARRAKAILDDWASVVDLALGERSSWSAGVPVLPSALDDASMAQIRSCFADDSAISSAQIIRKSVVRWVELPAYIVLVDSDAQAQQAAIASCIASLALDATVAVVSAPATGMEARSWTDIGVVVFRRKS
jgi:hypothetical protein